MRFNTEECYGADVLHVKRYMMGGPDGVTFHEQHRELRGDGHLHVVVDLRKVRYVNSSGLLTLFRHFDAVDEAVASYNGESSDDIAVELAEEPAQT